MPRSVCTFSHTCLSRFSFAALIATLMAVFASSGRGQQLPPQSTPPAAPPPAQTQTPAQQANPPQANALTRDVAVQMALQQASTFQQAQLSERLAAEDVRQARAAFLPRLTLPATFIYNSPLLAPRAPGAPREQSFIAENA